MNVSIVYIAYDEIQTGVRIGTCLLLVYRSIDYSNESAANNYNIVPRSLWKPTIGKERHVTSLAAYESSCEKKL